MLRRAGCGALTRHTRREWILAHPCALSPCALVQMLGEPGERSPILEHPSILKFLGTVHEVAPGVAVHFG
jgi:hypothetical protein